MNVLRHLILAVTMAASSVCVAQVGTPGNPTTGKAFIDRFTTLDNSRWYVSDGWSNGPHQNCTWRRENVRVDKQAALSLTDNPSPDRPFTCAELQTREFYGYGTYEVRMRPVPGQGVVTAFFTFTGSPHAPGRHHDEIDFEFLGKDTKGVFLNYFGNGRPHEQTVALHFDAAAAANDYAFEWTPESIRWFANGHLIREVKKGTGGDFPSHPQKIYVSIWNGIGWDQEAWLGRFRYPGNPMIAVFEYVAFTELGSPCHFPTSIVCQTSTQGATSR